MQSFFDFISAAWWYLLIIIAVSYLLGSVSFAIIVTMFRSKKDIRDFGSGNAGATNVLRSQGKLPALITTVGDLAKSGVSCAIGWFLMMIAAQHTAIDLPPHQMQVIGQYLAGFFCIIGHIYPVYYKFRGGKGVVATLGMALILDWRVALICLAAFIIVMLIWRMVSLGSVVGGLTMVIFTYIFRHFVDGWENNVVTFCTVMAGLITALLIIKHIPNIKRIIKGTESRFGMKKEEG